MTLPLGCRFIVRGIPQGHVVGGISLIWGITDYSEVKVRCVLLASFGPEENPKG